MATLPPVIPAEQGLGGAPTMATPADQPQEQAPTVQGPAQPTVENPSQSVAQHIMSALGGGTGNPMDWAKGIVAGGLAGAANVGKQPEGAGWLHGAAQGAQGILEQRRQQALDLQKQQQVQQEQQLKQKADARAEQELQIHMQDTKVQRALWTAEIARMTQEGNKMAFDLDQAKKLAPLAYKEQENKLQESQDKLDEAHGEMQGLYEATTGKKLSDERLVKDSSELTEEDAKQAAAGYIFPIHNGEHHEAGEDSVGVHLVNGDVWNMPIKKPVTITTPDGKDMTMQTGTSFATGAGIILGNMKSAENAQKLIMNDLDVKAKNAQIRNTNAEASLHETQAKQAKEGAGEGGGNIVDQIGTGRMIPERLGILLSRKDGKQLMSEVAAKYPDIDMAKLQQYPKRYDEFTSTKPHTAGFAINSGGTALKHMADLKAINDENPVDVRIKGTKAYKAYDNLMHTLSGELAQFYNLPQTDKSIESMGASLGGFFNRDAAILRQAKSMSEKIGSYEKQWENAQPSPNWHSDMPNMDDKAKAARAKLDPEYADRAHAEAVLPPEVSGKLQEGVQTTFANGQTWIKQNGVPRRVK